LEAWCDNTGESLALLLRKGGAGSNTVADHIEVLTQAITQIPARYRRDLLITADGAGASHGLVDHITTLDASPWRTVHYSIGWELSTRERAAIDQVPAPSWGTVLDDTGQPRDLNEAGVVELTALLRQGPHGDQLANWPADLRIIPPPRKTPPRRAAIPVRRTRRLALPTPGGSVALADDVLGQAELMGCRHRRVPPPESGFAGFRFPGEVIVLAVRWYLPMGCPTVTWRSCWLSGASRLITSRSTVGCSGSRRC
jgi:hypothetical protein